MMIRDSLVGDDDADMIMIVMIPDSLVGDDDAIADDSDDPWLLGCGFHLMQTQDVDVIQELKGRGELGF